MSEQTSSLAPATVEDETMPVQEQLFDRRKSPGPPHKPERNPPREQEIEPAPVWLQRASLIALVLVCFSVGALLTVLPWSQYYWDGNAWMLAHPAIQITLEKGWVRGIVSGIGLLDVWIGVSELLQYRDYRP